jgi:hypothetical protein
MSEALRDKLQQCHEAHYRRNNTDERVKRQLRELSLDIAFAV